VKVVDDLEKKLDETAQGFEKVLQDLADKVKPPAGSAPAAPTPAQGKGPQ